MRYTYSLDNYIGQIRFELGDTNTTEDMLTGMRPDGSSFTDEEIAYAYTAEGNHVMKAVARLCERLAREYSAKAGIQMLQGMSQSYMNMAKNFAKRAEEIRARYGGDFGTDSDATLTQVHPTRVDGFSSDIDANDV